MVLISIALAMGMAAPADTARCLPAETSAKYDGAANKPWFINSETITFRDKRYIKYGLPRLLMPGDVIPVGNFGDVAVTAEFGTTTYEIIYIPTARAGCEFQPYQLHM